jgi:MFS family permease
MRPNPDAFSQTNAPQPEMIESFGVNQKEVAKWAGVTSSVFSLSQCVTAIIWGRASDKFGRKPTILMGLTLTMITSLIWGASSSLPMAIAARALAGGCNGNGKYPFSYVWKVSDQSKWASSEPWWRKWYLRKNYSQELFQSCL